MTTSADKPAPRARRQLTDDAVSTRTFGLKHFENILNELSCGANLQEVIRCDVPPFGSHTCTHGNAFHADRLFGLHHDHHGGAARRGRNLDRNPTGLLLSGDKLQAYKSSSVSTCRSRFCGKTWNFAR